MLYLVYDPQGEEVLTKFGTPVLIKALSHNDAERKAVELYGQGSTVAYTEV
jgi:hypothetical protein